MFDFKQGEVQIKKSLEIPISTLKDKKFKKISCTINILFSDIASFHVIK